MAAYEAVHAYICGGGGVRIGAAWGAELAGEHSGAFGLGQFNWFAGTSSGALSAALSANGWGARQKIDLFLDTDFKRLFAPWFLPFGWRKLASVRWPMALQKLAEFIDGLGLQPVDNLLVNAVDMATNRHVIYCEQLPPWAGESQIGPDHGNLVWVPGAFSQLGYGRVLTRSMCLPGLVADDARYKDGGGALNGPLSAMPVNTTGVFMNLGFAGDVTYQQGEPATSDLIESGLYLFEFLSNRHVAHWLGHRPGLATIWPRLYDVDSSAFDLTRSQKQAIVNQGYFNTTAQWDVLTEGRCKKLAR